MLSLSLSLTLTCDEFEKGQERGQKLCSSAQPNSMTRARSFLLITASKSQLNLSHLTHLPSIKFQHRHETLFVVRQQDPIPPSSLPLSSSLPSSLSFDVLLSKGKHFYSIRFTTTRARLPSHDDLLLLLLLVDRHAPVLLVDTKDRDPAFRSWRLATSRDVEVTA